MSEIKMRSKRGMASADQATRIRVSRAGGMAPHEKQGLAAADEMTRQRVARAGGLARARDKEGLAAAGRKGGATVAEKYGREYYQNIGKKGGRRTRQ